MSILFRIANPEIPPNSSHCQESIQSIFLTFLWFSSSCPLSTHLQASPPAPPIVLFSNNADNNLILLFDLKSIRPAPIASEYTSSSILDTQHPTCGPSIIIIPNTLPLPCPRKYWSRPSHQQLPGIHWRDIIHGMDFASLRRYRELHPSKEPIGQQKLSYQTGKGREKVRLVFYPKIAITWRMWDCCKSRAVWNFPENMNSWELLFRLWMRRLLS